MTQYSVYRIQPNHTIPMFMCKRGKEIIGHLFPSTRKTTSICYFQKIMILTNYYLHGKKLFFKQLITPEHHWCSSVSPQTLPRTEEKEQASDHHYTPSKQKKGNKFLIHSM